MSKFVAMIAQAFLIVFLAGCGGGGGSSAPSGGASVTGLTTPPSVSVVTAN